MTQYIVRIHEAIFLAATLLSALTFGGSWLSHSLPQTIAEPYDLALERLWVATVLTDLTALIVGIGLMRYWLMPGQKAVAESAVSR